MDELTGFDRLMELVPGEGASAERAITSTSSIFATHFPRFPVLPGVLLLDGLARLGAVLLEADVPGDWQLVAVEQMKFRHYVQPGDRLDLSVRLLARSTDAAEVSARAEVAGRLVASARTLRFAREGGR